jgi:hypothetical protein
MKKRKREKQKQKQVIRGILIVKAGKKETEKEGRKETTKGER